MNPDKPGTPADLIRPERYPRSSTYDPAWLMSLDMGPNPLWQLEDLLPDLALQPGQRVLDLGSGKGATSVFLARECGATVVAADLWVSAAEATDNFVAAGVSDLVTAVNADVRSLPFADGEFDAVVSIDAFEYFGTDVHLLPTLLRVLKPGGRLAMSTPGLATDPYDGPLPDYVRELAGWEAACWHSPQWWHRHWELSGLVGNIRSRWQSGGRDDWLLWARSGGEKHGPVGADPVIRMLEQDVDEQLGFTLISATKN
ncbi:methyltransferase domain-containing protein [Nakamurella lactea]|uniref:methyltransferase domain-containing protein n=1 Tax=Nakamurella lactea TaxID=459515 RepID=UPI0003FBBC73|nr:methyltransferase domain-containing protein [Nakamurella lactea]